MATIAFPGIFCCYGKDLPGPQSLLGLFFLYETLFAVLHNDKLSLKTEEINLGFRGHRGHMHLVFQTVRRTAPLHFIELFFLFATVTSLTSTPCLL